VLLVSFYYQKELFCSVCDQQMGVVIVVPACCGLRAVAANAGLPEVRVERTVFFGRI